jgi:mannose-6-phosphate isomerase-like protein (cupin superfamily)
MSPVAPQRALIAPGEGEIVTDREGRQVVILAERDQLTITRSLYGPGERGPDPHVHREHTDAFYVLEGELEFRLGPEGESLHAEAGTLVVVPAGLVHSFDQAGDADARFLNFHAPDGGFARYMRDLRDGAEAAFDSFDPPADGGLPAGDAIVSGPGEGERMVSGSRDARMKCALGDLSLSEWEIRGPISGPPEHAHETQVDAFYVLEGELQMNVEGQAQPAGPHALASIPPGVRHTFAHPGDEPGRILNIHAPDEGFAEFLRGTSD